MKNGRTVSLYLLCMMFLIMNGCAATYPVNIPMVTDRFAQLSQENECFQSGEITFVNGYYHIKLVLNPYTVENRERMLLEVQSMVAEEAFLQQYLADAATQAKKPEGDWEYAWGDTPDIAIAVYSHGWISSLYPPNYLVGSSYEEPSSKGTAPKSSGGFIHWEQSGDKREN